MTERLSSARASRSGYPSSNLSVCFADSSPSRGASGEEARLCGMPRPPLGRGGGTASAVTERLSTAGAIRSGCPSSNLSVSLRSTAPLVGEPLAKRQSFAECQGLPSVGEVARRRRDGEVEFSKSFPVRLSFVQPLSLTSFDSSPSRGASGEEARLCGMPRPPLGRGGGIA